MTSPPLPDELRRFIHGHLPTMEHVDLLLLLVRAAPEARGAAAVAGDVRQPVEQVTRRLGQFVDDGLLVADDLEGVPVYRFAPRSSVDRRAVEHLLDAYNSRPVSLIREVYERPLSSALDFANAFRLRKPIE